MGCVRTDHQPFWRNYKEIRVSITVRDAVFETLRNHGVDRIFANPGSTEVDLLTDLPDHLEFVLALHEGSVVGIATGYAVATGRPALALLHTTAGYGNAVGALATARVNRAPMVLLVGQQDRRHLAAEPFLAGKLRDLAGEYPVGVHEPSRAADVPAAVARALHEATVHRGPAVVIVPMSDWAQCVDDWTSTPAPRELLRAAAIDGAVSQRLVQRIGAARRPALVVGSLADDPETWSAVAELADTLGCPVWQEAYAYRMGFDQTSPRFAGHLPPGRAALRAALAEHDLVLVLGAAAFRQYLYEPGPFVEEGTSVVVVTEDPDEAVRSAADLAVLAPMGATARELVARLPRRAQDEAELAGAPRTDIDTRPAAGPIEPAQVFDALARRLPAESTLFEESPSTRRVLLDRMPVRAPLGFLTAAMGGLGFTIAGATGVKMARPDRPVVAVLGDGASLYNIQTLWTAQKYGAGVLFVVMSNGGYAVMDRLAHNAGGKPPWPGFGEISVSKLAEGFGCPARRIEDLAELIAVLDEVVPTLAQRSQPLVLDVAVSV